MNRHFWRACDREAGFSFVELLVTIIIAGIAFAAMVPVFVSAQQASSGEQMRNVSLQLAQDKLEKVRGLDYDLITPDEPQSDTIRGRQFGTSVSWATGGGGSRDVHRHVSGRLHRQRRQPRRDARRGSYKQVTITTAWTGEPSPVKPVQLSTMVSQQYAGPKITQFNVAPLYTNPSTGTQSIRSSRSRRARRVHPAGRHPEHEPGSQLGQSRLRAVLRQLARRVQGGLRRGQHAAHRPARALPVPSGTTRPRPTACTSSRPSQWQGSAPASRVCRSASATSTRTTGRRPLHGPRGVLRRRIGRARVGERRRRGPLRDRALDRRAHLHQPERRLASESYEDITVTNGTTYYYRVRTIDVEGYASVYSTSCPRHRIPRQTACRPASPRR